MEGIGGILRHILADTYNIDFKNTKAVDASTMPWYFSTVNRCFTAVVPDKAPGSKMLCATYETQDNQGYAVQNLCVTGAASAGYTTIIWLRNWDIDNVAALKTSLKGIMFAYQIQ